MSSIELLAKGGFSHVYRKTTSSGKQRALKVINNTRNGVESPLELYIMKYLRHPQIMAAEYIKLQQNQTLICMELADSDLGRFIAKHGSPPVELLQNLFVQLLQGCAFLKAHDIIHGDLKSHNVLVFGGVEGWSSAVQLRVTDFTLSSYSPNGQERSDRAYTLHCRAPEIWRQLNWNSSADIWALGNVLYELTYGQVLFNCKKESDAYSAAISWNSENYDSLHPPRGIYTKPPSKWEQPEYAIYNQILLGLLHPNPEKRLDFKIALKRLNVEHVENACYLQAMREHYAYIAEQRTQLGSDRTLECMQRLYHHLAYPTTGSPKDRELLALELRLISNLSCQIEGT